MTVAVSLAPQAVLSEVHSRSAGTGMALVFCVGDDVDTLGPTNINWFLFEHPFVEQDHHLPG